MSQSLASDIGHITILRLLLVCLLSATTKGCLCFTKQDLLQFNENNTDFETSCRESHMLTSGIGIFHSYDIYDLDEDGDPLHDEYGYHVALNTEMPPCTIPGGETITLGSLKDGEDCAVLIREHCTMINHIPLEY